MNLIAQNFNKSAKIIKGFIFLVFKWHIWKLFDRHAGYAMVLSVSDKLQSDEWSQKFCVKSERILWKSYSFSILDIFDKIWKSLALKDTTFVNCEQFDCHLFSSSKVRSRQSLQRPSSKFFNFAGFINFIMQFFKIQVHRLWNISGC